jgi:pyruvate-formate lyase-activating enzyme
MNHRILLINPAIYDFSAYDFWLKPYGMLRVAGFLRGQAEFALFDYLNRLDPRVPQRFYRADAWGRGEFYCELVDKPAIFSGIRRRFKRFGLPREAFLEFLSNEKPFDDAFVQTGMTYWYLGVEEVIADVRKYSPRTNIIVGGPYATLCLSHARTLGADLVIEGDNLKPLWGFLGKTPRAHELPLWDLYPRLTTGVVKLADGCPFRCTYCSVPQVYPKFHARSLDRSLAELEWLVRCGAEHIAFYDDALLFKPEEILMPFLNAVRQRRFAVEFHTPNALNARFVNRELADRMVEGGFRNIYLGFESSAYAWQKNTGGKVYSEEFERAVENLVRAGTDSRHIHAYIIIGHPMADEQDVEESMRFTNRLGIRVMLSEFSPIPGTPDGELCRRWVDLNEPLSHNKTAFTILSLGEAEANRLKDLAAQLNEQLAGPAVQEEPEVQQSSVH